MAQNSKLAIGIDIGGTKINTAVININGEIQKLKKIKTKANHPTQLVSDLIENIKPFLKSYENILGIGLASAGRVISDKKIIGYATDNLKNWTEYPLVEKISEEFELPVYIDNDVNAALLAELKLNDSIKKKKNIVFITIGTGLGGAYAHKGKIVRGSTGSLGEFGHMVLYPAGLACNCGKYGCAEQYISGKAFKRRLEKKFKDCGFDIRKGDFKDRTIKKEIFNEHPLYRSALREMTEDLTLLMENIKNAVDFDICIIGGSFYVYKDIMLDIITERFAEYNHKYYKKPEFIFSNMGNKAGVIGAGLMVFDNLNNN